LTMNGVVNTLILLDAFVIMHKVIINNRNMQNY